MAMYCSKSHQCYLLALENLFVEKAASDIMRKNICHGQSRKNESIPLFVSRLVSLFNYDFPTEADPNKQILVIDKFV